MGLGSDQSSTQVVLKAMSSTQKVIGRLLDFLVDSQRKGIITPEIYDQLYSEILSMGAALKKEQERVNQISITDPTYAEVDDSIFECTTEELEQYKALILGKDRSAA